MKLIDADELFERISNDDWWNNAERNIIEDILDDMPTIDIKLIHNSPFNNDDFIKQLDLKRQLNCLLWKYSYEHGWSDYLWNDLADGKYKIVWNQRRNDYIVNECKTLNPSGCYFISYKIACRAIKEIIKPFIDSHPDFKW